jgi:hypothetical protein
MLIENQLAEQSQTEADTIYCFENKLVLSLFDPDRRQHGYTDPSHSGTWPI